MKKVDIDRLIGGKFITFPDTQTHVNIQGIKEKDEVQVICSITNIKKLFQLLQVSNSLDNLYATKKELIIPYLMGSRSDRIMIPGDSFDLKIVSDLNVDTDAIRRNLNTYGPFASTERLMMECAKRGGDRQELHHRVRKHAMKAWEETAKGKPNPLIKNIIEDEYFLSFGTDTMLQVWLSGNCYIGDAPERAIALSKEVFKYLKLGRSS